MNFENMNSGGYDSFGGSHRSFDEGDSFNDGGRDDNKDSNMK